MAVKQLSDGGAEGTCLGQSTTDKVGFFGYAPAAQRSGSAQAALATTAATTSTPYGFSQAQADGLIALANEMRAVLVAHGLMKGSA